MDTSYAARVAQQVAQYEPDQEIHDLPEIYHHWSHNFLRSKLRNVFGVESIIDFYVNELVARVVANPNEIPRFASLGAGDASLETEIAVELKRRGIAKFELHCLELSPILIERAQSKIASAGVQGLVQMNATDLNLWDPLPGEYLGVIANHTLHHIVELEQVFEGVKKSLGDRGAFITSDIIGRNGHMRWPEALAIIEALWDTLPSAWKYNHQLKRHDEHFVNWDCSKEAFEGIRAQDILPLLVRTFKFEKFLGFGNIPDVFVDRGFGPNLSVASNEALSFVTRVGMLNDSLLGLGLVKPTMMLAVLSNSYSGPVKVWENLTPEFCVRDPEAQAVNHLGQLVIPRSGLLEFSAGSTGRHALGDGWSYPEDWGVWMTGEEALVRMPVPRQLTQGDDEAVLTVRALAFASTKCPARTFDILIHGQPAGQLRFARGQSDPRSITFNLDCLTGRDFIDVKFRARESASPADDGSADLRRLGIGLISLGLRTREKRGFFGFPG